MSSKMLIDASHPEETRVVVLKGHRVEEFDFESANKRQLRGNIYLAKVTRVEPSLQAAFVDYGGNRHGFLAFSEIHPDYYQIPHADRQALLDEEARAHRDEDDESRAGGHRRSRRHKRDNAVSAMDRRGAGDAAVSEPAFANDSPDGDRSPSWNEGPMGFDGETDEAVEAEREFTSDTAQQAGPSGQQHDPADAEASAEVERESETQNQDIDLSADVVDLAVTAGSPAAAPDQTDSEGGTPVFPSMETPTKTSINDDELDASDPTEAGLARSAEAAAAMLEGGSDSLFDSPAVVDPDNGAEADEHGHEETEEEVVEQIGGDEFEDAVHRSPRARRHYKIQEVIKRRQILLVQVVKEERGNKGAALTTYLSLAGRYSVLMPNTARGGGISRKITDPDDRKRLKAIAQDLEVPEGMGIILRTAGAARGKVEVNRDFEYLLRMWESVRELTLKSTAPSLVYEEGSLIKRSIRDLYTRDVEDVIVAGEEGYREAKDFMRMLMPSAAKNVQLYADSQPIFAKTGAEAQLDAMFSNHVTLKSGGYLVINQTEALVAIDVNSGRSTREHNIEDTALRTNLEAADEIARQLRLRDLAGLIVVDFIDMEEGRNNRAVERRIKEALKNDRARIQIGRISHFGLLEMSRQRIRTGVLEGSTVICPHCAGAGTVRSTASIALHVLRLLEDLLIKDASHNLVVRSRTEVALYILNQKRSTLNDLEARFGVSLSIAADPTLTGMVYHAVERGELATPVQPALPRGDLVRVDSVAPLYDEGAGDPVADEDADEAESGEETDTDGEAASGEREFAPGDANGEGRRRKRRRRRRGRDREPQGEGSAGAPPSSDEGPATMARIGGDYPGASERSGEAEIDRKTLVEADAPAADGSVEPGLKSDDTGVTEPIRKRRSRRGSSRADDDAPAVEASAPEGDDGNAGSGSASGEDGGKSDDTGPVPKRRRSARARSTVSAPPEVESAAEDARPAADRDVGADSTGRRPPEQKAARTAGGEDGPLAQPQGGSARNVDGSAPAGAMPSSLTRSPAEPDSERPKRSGWWQRAKATFGS